MIDWLQQLWDTLTAISLPILILGIAFQTAQTLPGGARVAQYSARRLP